MWCRKTDLLNSKSRRKATYKEEVAGAGLAGNCLSEHCPHQPWPAPPNPCPFGGPCWQGVGWGREDQVLEYCELSSGAMAGKQPRSTAPLLGLLGCEASPPPSPFLFL